jgi:hypothetical protein
MQTRQTSLLISPEVNTSLSFSQAFTPNLPGAPFSVSFSVVIVAEIGELHTGYLLKRINPELLHGERPRWLNGGNSVAVASARSDDGRLSPFQ